MPILSNLRKARSTYQKAKQKKEQIMASFKLISLGKYMNPFIDWLYGIALILAIFKDVSDLVGLGSLPVIGTLVTAGVSSVIWFIMLITWSGAKKKLARYSALILGTTIEMFFGLNFFPIETFVVVFVFYLTLKGRRLADMEKQLAEAEAKRDYNIGAEPAYY
jgi:hypothetical protein